MTVKDELHVLVDRLAVSELETARRLLTDLRADVDDDPVTPEEMAEIEEGAAQIQRGESMTLAEFKRAHRL